MFVSKKFSFRFGSFVLVHFTPGKRHLLHFLCFCKKHDFVLKISLRVIFLIEKNTTRQTLN